MSFSLSYSKSLCNFLITCEILSIHLVLLSINIYSKHFLQAFNFCHAKIISVDPAGCFFLSNDDKADKPNKT